MSQLSTPLGRLPRRLILRFLLLAVLVAAGFVALRVTPLADLVTTERVLAMLDELREAWWSPLALLGLYLVLCPLGFPATPLILAGGVVFGAAAGGLLNYSGTFLGAASTFFLGHHLGRGLIVHLFGHRLARMEKLLHRHSFAALVRIRFVPVPFPVVNYGAALAGVRWPVFLAANAVGLAPAVFLYTWFAAALVEATGEQRGGVILRLAAILAGLFLVSFLPTLWRGRRRRRRYRDLLERRRIAGRGSRDLVD